MKQSPTQTPVRTCSEISCRSSKASSTPCSSSGLPLSRYAATTSLCSSYKKQFKIQLWKIPIFGYRASCGKDWSTCWLTPQQKIPHIVLRLTTSEGKSTNKHVLTQIVRHISNQLDINTTANHHITNNFPHLQLWCKPKATAWIKWYPHFVLEDVEWIVTGNGNQISTIWPVNVLQHTG
jgi:hypothetical protein